MFRKLLRRLFKKLFRISNLGFIEIVVSIGYSFYIEYSKSSPYLFLLPLFFGVDGSIRLWEGICGNKERAYYGVFYYAKRSAKRAQK